MAHDKDEQEFLAPEDDWDLPQPERPMVPHGATPEARHMEPARTTEPPEQARPPESPQSQLAAIPLATHPRAEAAHAPIALMHSQRPDLFPALAARSALFRIGRSAPITATPTAIFQRKPRASASARGRAGRVACVAGTGWPKRPSTCEACALALPTPGRWLP